MLAPLKLAHHAQRRPKRSDSRADAVRVVRQGGRGQRRHLHPDRRKGLSPRAGRVGPRRRQRNASCLPVAACRTACGRARPSRRARGHGPTPHQRSLRRRELTRAVRPLQERKRVGSSGNGSRPNAASLVQRRGEFLRFGPVGSDAPESPARSRTGHPKQLLQRALHVALGRGLR